MILTVGNTKGGVGKTTLAMNIAIERANSDCDVLLVDGDEQGSASTYTDVRTEQLGQPGYTAVSLKGAAIRVQVRQLAPKYDEVLIDAGGRDTVSLRAALLVSDKVLIPVLPRSLEIWALDQIAALISEAQELNTALRAYSVINAADTQGHDNPEAAQMLQELAGITFLPCTIVRRKVYPNATATGRAVTEYTPKDPKAIAELQALIKALYGPDAVS
jgi:chromosome partitioning protein